MMKFSNFSTKYLFCGAKQQKRPMFNKASVLVSGGENENYHEAAV
jgi:hypothetical protein